MASDNPVINAARERALLEFSALTLQLLRETDRALLNLFDTLHSAFEQRNVGLSRDFLRLRGDEFRKQLEFHFADNLQRALATMYIDLRGSLRSMSSDSLSLIDDETVNSQLEVGRLVQRIHEADQENLNQLNIVIAQLHGNQQVRERENPFRPYLIARTLHQVMQQMQLDEHMTRILFNEMSNSLIRHCQGFYAAIYQVFVERGITPQLSVKPSPLSRDERLQQARQALAARNAGEAGANLSSSPQPVFASGGAAAAEFMSTQALPVSQPHLQRLQSLLQQMMLAGAAANAGSGEPASGATSMQLAPEQQVEAFQNFVWKIFNQSADQATSSALADGANIVGQASQKSLLAPAPEPVINRLHQYQKLAARGEMIDEQLAPGANQLFVLRDMIGLDQVPVLERIAIDVVAMLFDFMLDDEQIPAELRKQIGRLQIPFLKAAMLGPEMLQQPDHAARQLLNRMSSAAIGVDPATAVGQQFTIEFTRIVELVLDTFTTDVSVFANAVHALEQFLTQHLQHADVVVERSVEAIEQMECANGLTAAARMQLAAILPPLQADSRVVDFIQQVWIRVLVQAALADEARGNGTEADNQFLRCRNVMPELIWSAYPTQDLAQRSALIRLLPRLVKTLKAGLTLINLTEEESRQALNMLIEMHAERLRVSHAESTAALLTLEQLEQRFANFSIGETSAVMADSSTVIDVAVMQTTFERQGIDASMEPERSQSAQPDRNQYLLEQLNLGTCVERWSGSSFELARVTWISKRNTIYMFKLEKNSRPIVYSTNSLVRAMQDKQVRLVEYAPVFERAMDAILLGAESVLPAYAMH